MGNGSDTVRFVALSFALTWVAWAPIVARLGHALAFAGVHAGTLVRQPPERGRTAREVAVNAHR